MTPYREVRRCSLPCSFCGRFDIPIRDAAIRWSGGQYKPGDVDPVCSGYAEPCLAGGVHPCSECVLYAPRPFPQTWRVAEVKYEGRVLGRIPVPDEDDSADKSGTMGHIGRRCLVELLERNKTPAGMDPQPWILSVLRGIGYAMLGRRNSVFEDQIMSRHLRHYGGIAGMERLLKVADPTST
jgi:hypothetical protein